jgi:hypothetical protein
MLVTVDHQDMLRAIESSLRTQLATKLGISLANFQLDEIARHVTQAVLLLDSADRAWSPAQAANGMVQP